MDNSTEATEGRMVIRWHWVDDWHGAKMDECWKLQEKPILWMTEILWVAKSQKNPERPFNWWCQSAQQHTVDGRNPAPGWYGKYPIIYRLSYMLGGCLGFLPSTVLLRGWSFRALAKQDSQKHEQCKKCWLSCCWGDSKKHMLHISYIIPS